MLSFYIMFLFCAINQLINKLMLDMKCDLWQFQPTKVPRQYAFNEEVCERKHDLKRFIGKVDKYWLIFGVVAHKPYSLYSP